MLGRDPAVERDLECLGDVLGIQPPQGQALASMIQGIVGGDVPTYRYGAGAGLGLLGSGAALSGGLRA